jgi:hypothetical protein
MKEGDACLDVYMKGGDGDACFQVPTNILHRSLNI